jgi:hypothetical protein
MIDYNIFSESFFEELIEAHPQLMLRAAKSAAFGWVMPEIKAAIGEAFETPTPYTLNSTRFEITSDNPPVITIYLRQPDRMGKHYLTAQVEGGERQKKGFERQMNLGFMMPADSLPTNKYGNISRGKYRQILSAIGNTGYGGYDFAINKSSRRNKKERDYFLVPWGDPSGLHPGVYHHKARGKKASTRSWAAGQKGKRGGVVRARGIEPVFLAYSKPTNYKKRLDFYDYAADSFRDGFEAEYNELLAGV